MMLFHIIAELDWVAAKDVDLYQPQGLRTEGFIHLSQKGQILRPANLLYRGRNDLKLLVIDPSLLVAEVVYEPGSHGETEHFPHLYGPLNVVAVVDVIDFPPGADGTFDLPPGLVE